MSNSKTFNREFWESQIDLKLTSKERLQAQNRLTTTKPVTVELTEEDTKISPEDISTITEQLTTLLGSLSGNKIMKNVPLAVVSNLIAGLVSSTFSLISSIYSLRSTYLTTTGKALHITSIVTSLGHLAVMVATLCEYWKVIYDLTKAKTALSFIASKFMDGITSNAGVDYIVPVISTITVVLLAGTTLVSPSGIKSIINLGHFSRAAKSIRGDAQELTEWICEELLHLDLKGDETIYNDVLLLANESTTLCSTPVYKLVTDGEAMNRLTTFPERAIKATSAIIKSGTKAKALISAKTLLVQNIQTIKDRKLAIDAIQGQSRRVETIGVMLAGEPGVGKTTLITYIAKKLGKLFAYDPTLYSLNKEDGGFALPYGGQAFAIYDEFMAKRASGDALLKNYNLYVSAGPANLESAHLDGKVQPVAFKVLFFTCNQLNPKLDTNDGLTTEATRAFWDRTYRYEVLDPKVEGRAGANEHRRPDYSHLTINAIKPKIERYASHDDFHKTPYSVKELIDQLALAMAEREIRYLDQIADPSIEPRIRILRNIITPQHQANSGRNYCVVRIQGRAGTGKTQLASKILNMFKEHYPHFQSSIPTELEPENNPVRSIYIIDDMVYTVEDKLKYFRWINSIHPESITIFVTNDIIPLQSTWLPLSAPYRKVDSYPQLPDGYARRIGLTGNVYYGSTPVAISDGTGLVIDTSPNYVLQLAGQPQSMEDVLDSVFKTYNIHIVKSDGIRRVMEKYTGLFEPDVEVIAETLPKLTKTLQSKATLLQAYLTEHDGTSFKVSTEFLDKAKITSMPKDWLVQENVDTPEKLYGMCERLCGAVKRINHEATVHVRINAHIDVVYKDNVLYIYAPEIETIDLEERDGKLFYLNYEIDCVQFAEYIVNHRLSPSLTLLPELALREIRRKLDMSDSPICKAYNNQIRVYELQHQIKLDACSLMTTWIKEHKILTLCGTIFSLYITYRAGKFLYKKLFTNDKGKYNDYQFLRSNMLCSEPDDAMQGFRHQLRKALIKGDLEGVRGARDAALQHSRGAFEDLNEYEYNLRSNSYTEITKYIKDQSYGKLVGYVSNNPEESAEYMLRHKPNMLAPEDVFSTPTMLDVFMRKLKSNYVALTSEENARCYGLCIRDNYIITVSHMFETTGESVTIHSNGVQYQAKVTHLNRARDLAQLEVTSKNWPMAADITNKFLPNRDATSVTETWFLRPGPESMAINTCSEYRSKAVMPCYDPACHKFQLSESYWTSEFRSHDNLHMIIRDGDCGLPLVGLHQNKIYIIGIHNSYQNISGYAFFSLVDKCDLGKTVKSNNFLTNPPWHIRHPTKAYTVTTHPRVQSMLDTLSNSVFGNLMNDGLPLLGFSNQAKLYSNPKHDKILFEVPNLEVEKWPSALVYSPQLDSTKLVKDMKGRPHTLMSQAMKYVTRTPQYGSWNSDIFNHVEKLISIRFRRDYDFGKPLNMKEILNGLDNLGPMVLDTSPGPIFKSVYNINDKRQIFTNKSKEGDVPFYEVADNEYGKAFKDWFHTYDQSLSGGIPILILSKDNAKVELLPKEKVRDGGVRLFNEICVTVNAVLKKYFGRLINSVQSKYFEGPYAMGANSYVMGSFILKKFSLIDNGIVANTDYSRFDKTIPKEMISSFCKIALQYLPENVQKAFAQSLTYVLHTLDGHMYMVNSGNESGSYVTTLLNCFVVEFTTLYTATEKYYEKNGNYPTLNELEKIFAAFYCGDDATICVSRNYFTTDDRIRVNAMFNLTLTEAKVESNHPSFCSRVIVPDPREPTIGYPALKQSSITACLMYYPKPDPDIIAMNCNAALFEASLHEKEFFDKIEEAAMYLSKKHGLTQKIDWLPYGTYRVHFKKYVKGLVSSPFETVYSTTANTDRTDPNKNKKFLRIFTNSQNYIQLYLAKMDPISQLNHYVQTNVGIKPPKFSDTSSGPSNDPIWTTTCELMGVDGQPRVTIAAGKTKQEARRQAAGDMVSLLMQVRKANSAQTENHLMQAMTTLLQYGDSDQGYQLEIPSEGRHYPVKPNSLNKVLEQFVLSTNLRILVKNQIYSVVKEVTQSLQSVTQHRIYLSVFDATILNAMEPVLQTENSYYRFCFDEHVYLQPEYFPMNPRILKASMMFDTDVHIDGIGCYYECLVPKVGVTSNSSTENVHPDAVRQAALNQSMSTVVHAMNPQPSGVAPSLAPPGETGMANQEILKAECMNPIGPPNMLTFGAITFDIKTLISSQYLDSDYEVSWTEGLSAGTILAQIPYDPLGTHVNKYIKAYVNLHQRYHGDLMYRITVLGNPLYSGYLGVAWVPRKITGSTIAISELQKYAYEAKGVTMPWSCAYALKDARRNNFWREVDDDDINDRPHLVIAPIMTVENPLKDGVKVRLRIASKLATMMDGSPENPVNEFVVSEPKVGSSTLSVQLPETPGIMGTALEHFMPGARFYLDGGRMNRMRGNDDSFAFMYSKYQTNVNYMGNLQRQNWVAHGLNRFTEEQQDYDVYPCMNLSQINPTVCRYVRASLNVSGNFTAEGYTRFARLVPAQVDPKLFLDAILNLDDDILKSSVAYTVPIYLFELGHEKHMVCWKSAKIVTDYGTFIFKIFCAYYSAEAFIGPASFSTPLKYGPTEEQLCPYAQNLNIDAEAYHARVLPSLPVGYTGLVLSTIPASSITVDGWQNPTATTDYSFLRTLEAAIDRLGSYNKTTQVIQLTAKDIRNLLPVFYARYDPDDRQLYVKPFGVSSQFRILPVELQHLSLSLQIVEKSTQFPITNVDDWVDRTTNFFARTELAKVPSVAVTSNAALAGAMIAGGALQGAGAGIGGFAQGMFSIKQQERQHKFLQQMQQSGFEQQLLMQQNSQYQEMKMQGNMFQQQVKLQNQDLGNRRDMQASDQLFRKEMRGFSNPAALFSQ